MRSLYSDGPSRIALVAAAIVALLISTFFLSA